MEWTVRAVLMLAMAMTAMTVSASWYPMGIDAAMAEHMASDPNATKDSLHSLPASLRKAMSMAEQHTTIPHRISYLLNSLEVLLPVRVSLVGFSTDDTAHLANHITSYIHALHTNQPYHVISPSPSDTHNLAARSKLSVEVEADADGSLSGRLADAIRSNMEPSTPVMRSHLHSVPHTAVDSIIAAHHQQQHLQQKYTVYLLNLPKQDKSYAYSYDSRSASSAYAKCLGTIWTSAPSQGRYLWVDLGAGPVEYGPSISGDGLLPRGEFHPLTSSKSSSDLSSLVWSAASFLFRPSLRIPAFPQSSLAVQFVHIRSADAADLDPRGVDWESIESAFLQNSGSLLFHDQSLRFRRYSIHLPKCPLCTSILSRSTRSFTSRFLFENYTMLTTEYLDSKTLHHLLSESRDTMAKLAGIPEHSDDEFAIPVYVWDVNMDRVLLLDRYHQSMAFKDMVVAVRTLNSQSMADYSCNGRNILIHTRSLERPIVGSILQSLWGVSPTHLAWSPSHNASLADYTWSVGPTPFGPFSQSTSLSFVQTDSALRNVLLTSLNATVTNLLDVFHSVLLHGGEKKLLDPKRQTEVRLRWNLLRYKLDKALSAISHFDFNQALYFLKSSDFDLFEIHNLFYIATTQTEASLVCFKDPPFPWISALFVLLSFIAVYYAFVRRDRLFRNKMKKF